MPPPRLTISIQAGRLAGILAAIAALLVIANCAGIFIRATFDVGWIYWIKPLFDLDTESNFPSLFSTGLFLVNAALLFLIGSLHLGALKRSSRISWLMLAVIFFGLGIDECISIHEKFVDLLRKDLDVGGVFHFAWVIPYGIATVLLGGVLAPWFLRLNRRTQILFGSSAGLFLFGAVGLEMIAGRYLEQVAMEKDVFYQVMYTVEETLEMSGLILFAYGLMDFLRLHQGVLIRLEVASTDETTDTPIRATDSASRFVS